MDGVNRVRDTATYKRGDLVIVNDNGRLFWHRVTDETGLVPSYPGLGWTEYVGGLTAFVAGEDLHSGFVYIGKDGKVYNAKPDA